MDRIDCLRAFVRTLEGGSFSAAAKELGIGQPAISKRIAMLESEFGTQLFLRTTRTLKPTAEAHRIYDLARQILDRFDMARSSVEKAAPRPTGTLRIGVPSSFGRRYMMPVIAEYVRNYPEVRVDIRFSERLVNLVQEGIELALRIGDLEASTLVARRLGTVQRYLVATPGYLHGRPMPRTPDDLSSHQCIVYWRMSPAHQWAFESEHGRHVASINGPIHVDDADAMQEATMHHLGIAILPEWNAANGLRSGELEHLLPDYAIAALPLHAVYPETHWMSLRARSFLDLLVERAEHFAGGSFQSPGIGTGN
ncbi:LysR substrate-binding domain-containing protein [Bradyrhizobium sp. LLZ17]|uniref:LysR substrate-binding domain-containing protein n=1 Tax=Bradyrhizobium sp. LLZ17 TaxID=3239388 RepID=A0AB39XBA2_9BRAD